jgi:hypothetical protein
MSTPLDKKAHDIFLNDRRRLSFSLVTCHLSLVKNSCYQIQNSKLKLDCFSFYIYCLKLKSTRRVEYISSFSWIRMHGGPDFTQFQHATSMHWTINSTWNLYRGCIAACSPTTLDWLQITLWPKGMLWPHFKSATEGWPNHTIGQKGWFDHPNVISKINVTKKKFEGKQ